jgi:hypothetical protein
MLPVGPMQDRMSDLTPRHGSTPINQFNRAAVSYSLASKLVKVSNVLWCLWRCFHERQREVQKGDHNIAARLPEMIGRFSELHGLKAYQSDVVLFSGPRQWIPSIPRWISVAA